MGKLSYNEKLRTQTFREQGLGAKSIISSYPDKGWNLSTVNLNKSAVESTTLAQPFCVNQAVGDLPRHFHFMAEYSKFDRVKKTSTRGKINAI